MPEEVHDSNLWFSHLPRVVRAGGGTGRSPQCGEPVAKASQGLIPQPFWIRAALCRVTWMAIVSRFLLE